jgi:hypothetical protein
MQTLARQSSAVFACAVAVCSFAACSDSDDDDASESANTSDMTFFVTSTTHDGDLGGLEGADQICDDLATAVGAGDHEWRAYLSAEDGGNGSPVNARDRIGAGPWINAAGVTLADSLEELHSASMVGNAQLFINEKRERINGQWNGSNGMDGNPQNEHDIMTGSDSNGMLLMTDMTSTCADWTSNSMTPGPQVGHSDGMGPGMDTSTTRFTSWNSGHPTGGCSAEMLAPSGSTGRIYCFAAD